MVVYNLRLNCDCCIKFEMDQKDRVGQDHAKVANRNHISSDTLCSLISRKGFYHRLPKAYTKILVSSFFTQNCHTWWNKRAVGPTKKTSIELKRSLQSRDNHCGSIMMGVGEDIRHDVPPTFWLGDASPPSPPSPCGGAYVLSHGILEGLGLKEQSLGWLGYSGPDESGTCAMKTVFTILLGGAFGNEIVWKRWILKQVKNAAILLLR